MLAKIEVGGDGDNREWDGWMASPTQWKWVWVNSTSWWWTWRPDMLQFLGSQWIGHHRANWLTDPVYVYSNIRIINLYLCRKQLYWLKYRIYVPFLSPDSSVGKESACNVRELGLIPGLGRSPGEGKGFPLLYSDLENSLENSLDYTGSQRVGHNWETFTFLLYLILQTPFVLRVWLYQFLSTAHSSVWLLYTFAIVRAHLLQSTFFLGILWMS